MDEEFSQETKTDSENQSSLSKKERRELRREEKWATTASMYKAQLLRRVVLWVVAIAAIGGAIAGVTYLAISSDNTPNNDGKTLLTNSLTPSDWVRGNAASSVSLIEYGDFQCPACGQYHPIVKKLEEEFGNKVAFSFRHFPLSQVHPNATSAAQAAEAAGAQGKFWEMHNLLFERQLEWSPKPSPKGTFRAYANELKLDINKFEDDMNRSDIEDKINSQYQSGIASGVNSTPTFFLNGVKLQNISSYDEFRHMLAQAVEATATPTPTNTATTTSHEKNL